MIWQDELVFAKISVVFNILWRWAGVITVCVIYTYFGLQRSSVSVVKSKFNAFCNCSHMEATLLVTNNLSLVSSLKAKSRVSYLNCFLLLYALILKYILQRYTIQNPSVATWHFEVIYMNSNLFDFILLHLSFLNYQWQSLNRLAYLGNLRSLEVLALPVYYESVTV